MYKLDVVTFDLSVTDSDLLVPGMIYKGVVYDADGDFVSASEPFRYPEGADIGTDLLTDVARTLPDLELSELVYRAVGYSPCADNFSSGHSVPVYYPFHDSADMYYVEVMDLHGRSIRITSSLPRLVADDVAAAYSRACADVLVAVFVYAVPRFDAGTSPPG